MPYSDLEKFFVNLRILDIAIDQGLVVCSVLIDDFDDGGGGD